MMWIKIAFWFKQLCLNHMSTFASCHGFGWRLLQQEGTIALHIREGQVKRQTLFSLILCYTNWLQTARIFCQMVSFSNRTVHLYTLHVWHKSRSPLDSSARMSGHWTPRSWIHWIIMSGRYVRALPHVSAETISCHVMPCNIISYHTFVVSLL